MLRLFFGVICDDCVTFLLDTAFCFIFYYCGCCDYQAFQCRTVFSDFIGFRFQNVCRCSINFQADTSDVDADAFIQIRYFKILFYFIFFSEIFRFLFIFLVSKLWNLLHLLNFKLKIANTKWCNLGVFCFFFVFFAAKDESNWIH